MTRILILGASLLQIPAIKKAKELGFFVGVIDYNPCAPGIELADVYYNVSTIDSNEILEVAKEFRADGIMTMATDMPIRAVAKTCEKLQLPSITMETATIATDKYKMMEIFKEHLVPHPWFYRIKSEKELIEIKKELMYPCIIKPIDNSGSRGVILVQNEMELVDSYLYSLSHSKSGNVVIQEFLKGKEVSVEIMFKNKKPNIVAITDKITTGAPFFVEMGHSQPSQLSEKEISEVAKKAVLAVGIDKGAAHVEIMVTSEGPKLIELGARLGGDYITSHLVPLSTGVDIVKAVILDSCGMDFSIESTIAKCSMIKYLSAEPGLITDIQGIEKAIEIPGIIDVKLFKEIGSTITDIHSSNDRIGYVIAQKDNFNILESCCDEALDCIDICISN